MMTRLKGPRLGTAIVIIAVALIPLLYAGLLTMTYQNPTNRLSDMTAAIVNEDQEYTGTLVTGKEETFSLGEELTDALVNPEEGQDVGFTWKEMTSHEAQQGLNDESIRAILYIPSDFSRNVAKIGTDIGSSATQELRLVTDDGVNYLSGTMAKTVAETMTNRINERGANKITDRLLVSIEKVRTGLADAADGSTQLSNATTKLDDGVTKLSDGIGKLSDGSTQLSQGSGRLVVGVNDLLNGSVTLRNGLVELDGGASRAADGSRKLAVGLTDLNSAMTRAENGSGELEQGANQLAAGLSQLSDKTGQLGGAITQLANGTQALLPGVQAYTEGVDKVSAGSAQLRQSATALPDALEKMRAGVGQPGDFDPGNPASAQSSLTAGSEALSAGLEKLNAGVSAGTPQAPSLQDGATQIAGITDLLATTLADVDLSKVPQLVTGTKQLSASLDQYTRSVDQLAAQCQPADSQVCQGLAQLSTSSPQLRSSAQNIEDVTFTLGTKAKALEPLTVIMNQLAQGAQALKAGVDQVADGSGALVEGSKALTANLGNLSSSVGELQAKVGASTSSQDGTLMGGITDINAGLAQLSEKSAQLRSGTQQLADGISQLNGKVPELSSGVVRLDEGAGQVSQGATTLHSGLSQLLTGSTTAASSSNELAAGLGELKDGVDRASNGSQTLAGGLSSAREGVGVLNSGAQELNNGLNTANSKMGELTQGTQQLHQGADKLRAGLVEGEAKIPQLTNAEQNNVSDTAAKVAEVVPVRQHAVANNGAGFTPMFMSLALWIGTIALFLVLPALDREERARGRWIQAVTKPAVTATILAIVQAVIMMVVVNAMGELHAANIVGLSALAVLTSICFMAINQACVAAFAFRGRFLSIVLLSLQITSMGATFPIETAPRFFQWIHWFLPMSDTQLAFRSLIAGGGVDGIIAKTVMVLVIWTLVSVAVSFFASKVRTQKNMSIVHDEALAPTAG